MAGREALYPILIRLADRGLVEASWQEEPPAPSGTEVTWAVSPAVEGIAAEPGAEVAAAPSQDGAPVQDGVADHTTTAKTPES